MNLSTVRNIYATVGKEKFKSMTKPVVRITCYKKSLHPNTLKKISKFIKTNRKVGREYLLKHSGYSRTTTELCIKVLFDKFLIEKHKNYELPGNPAVYVWAGV